MVCGSVCLVVVEFEPSDRVSCLVGWSIVFSHFLAPPFLHFLSFRSLLVGLFVSSSPWVILLACGRCSGWWCPVEGSGRSGHSDPNENRADRLESGNPMLAPFSFVGGCVCESADKMGVVGVLLSLLVRMGRV